MSKQREAAEAGIVYRRAGVIAVFTLISRVLGMLRDLVLAYRFGAGAATDAWVQALRIPNTLRRLTAEGSMNIAFVPVYTAVREEEGREAATRFAQQVLGLIVCATTVLVILGMLFSGPIAALTSPGFLSDTDKLALTTRLLRGCFPYLALISIVAWAMGLLHSEGYFAAPAAAPCLFNLSIIVAVLGLAPWLSIPIESAVLGLFVGGVGQCMLQLPSLRAVGVSPRPRGHWNEPRVRELLRLWSPAILNLCIYQANLLIGGAIASFLPTGQIFHYNNASRLAELSIALFPVAFSSAGLPVLSQHIVQANWPRVREVLRLTWSASSYAALPAAVGLGIAAEGIVAMLFLRGAYGVEDVRSTVSALRWLALSLPAMSVIRLATPICYAWGNSRAPMLAAAISLPISAGTSWWLSQRMEIAGLAAGWTLGSWFQGLLLICILLHLTRDLGRWMPLRAILRQGFAAALMGVFVWYTHSLGSWSLGLDYLPNLLYFLLCIGGGGGVYVLATLAMRDPQAREWGLLLLRSVRSRRKEAAERGPAER